MAAGTDAMLQSWNSLQACRLRLSAIRSDSAGSGEALIIARCSSHYDRSLLAAGVVPGYPQSSAETSSSSSGQVGSAAPATCSEVPPKPPRASASCLATVRRFTRASRFSTKMAGRLGCSRRPSLVANYQSKWSPSLPSLVCR